MGQSWTAWCWRGGSSQRRGSQPALVCRRRGWIIAGTSHQLSIAAEGPTKPALAQAKSLSFLDTRFFVDEYRAVFLDNVTSPAVNHARDLVNGSFELFSTRTAESTNELVRRLSFMTKLLGAIRAIAGIFGMNFETPYLQSGVLGFWSVIGVPVATRSE